MINRRHLLAVTGATMASFAIGATPARAAEPMLTLKGAFGKAGPDGQRQSSLGDLDALPQTSFATTTPWHKGVVKFSGVALKDYLAALEAKPRSLRFVALNDYSVDGKVDDLLAGDALLATRQNGETMPVSDKGPVFLIFPFDSRSELQHQTYYSRSVWQLTEIDIIA